MSKNKEIFKKNCFTCKHLGADWDDREYSSQQWYLCSKGEYDLNEERSEKMYDKDGKEAPYLNRYKPCHEFPSEISFNYASFVKIVNCVKGRKK